MRPWVEHDLVGADVAHGGWFPGIDWVAVVLCNDADVAPVYSRARELITAG
ncbi:hypothetical protein [Jiangella asiatica]|uniref:hypothetical protein n=1 Tax=Jiangella asiatica TaxID=2530372 RepID=UPI0013A5DD7C|nr:hypothetical protein [Jiangella asiatica]